MRIVRVGVMNNFNFTEKEIEELKKYEKNDLVFVNSNSFVSIKNDFPSIVTINPYLRFSEPVGDFSNVKACRVKVCVGANASTELEEKNAMRWSVEHGIPVLITFQRFSKIETMNKFVHVSDRFPKNENYHFNSGWLRPKREAMEKKRSNILYFVDSNFPDKCKNMIYFCDWSGNGCESCKNCIKLTYPGHENEPIYGLNLSCSGDNGRCIFNCVDCFAKDVYRFASRKNQSAT